MNECLGMLLSTLGADLLRNMLAGKGWWVVRAAEGKKEFKRARNKDRWREWRVKNN